MIDVNWDQVEERTGEFQLPEPGGYIATIVDYVDHEDKQYLEILWDFAEGPHKGENQATYDRSGFWPTKFLRSYKPKALGFFKAFKTCLEVSNRGYQFQTRNLDQLIGKQFGVVLGLEEYRANSGETKTRLYVAQARSVKAIQDGDFQVPKRKPLQRPVVPGYTPVQPQPYTQQPVQQGSFGGYAQPSYVPSTYDARVPGNWTELPDDGNVPF